MFTAVSTGLAGIGVAHKIEKSGLGNQAGKGKAMAIAVLFLLSVIGCSVLGIPKPASCPRGNGNRLLS